MKEILIEKARNCKNVDEVLSLAKSNKVEISKKDAERILNKLHNNEGELSESELLNVSGGASCGRETPFRHTEYPSEKDVVFVAKVGQTVDRYKMFGNDKKTVKITRCFIDHYLKDGKKHYFDMYSDDTGASFERQDIACVY